MSDSRSYINKNRDKAERILNNTPWRDLGYQTTDAMIQKAIVYALLGLTHAIEELVSPETTTQAVTLQ